MEKAAQMLSASSASIQTIAYENGFNDSGYFARLFKRHYGVTPHQWRNK
ncbi:helix-turn-helix transcriptional regulator [Selenomonas ruminantium]